jgi:hypothetical protein
MISTNTRIVAIVGSVMLLVLIVELVRRRRMKEEYSILWVGTAIVLIVVAAWGGALHFLTHTIGAVSESSALYFFGLLFVIFLLLHFSVRVSLLERRLTALVQEIALLARKEVQARHLENDDLQAAEAAGDLLPEPAIHHDDVTRA